MAIKKWCSYFSVPFIDNRLICKYPWEKDTSNHADEQNTIYKISLIKLLFSPLYGAVYMLWKLITCILIPKDSANISNVFFISTSIHIKEFSNSDDSTRGFWGNVKNLHETKNLNPIYVLVPYKQITVPSNLSNQGYNIADLRSFRSKFFPLRYFSVLCISNLYFISKLISLAYFFPDKNSLEYIYILKNYNYLLGKNLSSAIYLKLLFIDFHKSIPGNSTIIYTCEGQSWEFSLLLSNKKEVKFYGNLHVPYREMDSQIKSYSLLSLIKKPKEVEFIVTGQVSKLKFAEVTGNAFSIFELEAQRFIYAPRINILKPKFYDNTIALYLDTNFETNETLISLVKHVAHELNYTKIFVNDHPSLINKKLYANCEPLVVANSKDSNQISSINLFSPSTSTMIQSKFLGKVVAIYQPIKGESALWGIDKKFFFYDEKSFFDVINIKPILTSKDLWKVVNLDGGLPFWKSFLGNLHV
jgi:hypothetical protein